MSTVGSNIGSLLGNSGSSSSSSSTSSSAAAAAASASAYNLTPADFIQMMVTQLENQDPTQPMSNSDLLSQMSQIGQLQSTDSLQTTMSSVTLQTQIGSASSLIGKSVAGLDANNAPISGTVNSVQVAGGNVTLQLDDGTSMALAQLSTISPASSSSSSSGSKSTTATTGS